jgi:hypothetical protein
MVGLRKNKRRKELEEAFDILIETKIFGIQFFFGKPYVGQPFGKG